MLKRPGIIMMAIFLFFLIPLSLSAQSTVNMIVGYAVPLSVEPEHMLSSGEISLLYEVCVQVRPNFDVSFILKDFYQNGKILFGVGTSLFSTRGQDLDMRGSFVCGIGNPNYTGVDFVASLTLKNHFRVLKNWDLVIAPAIEWRAPLVSPISAQPRFVASLGAGVAYRKGE